MNTSHDWQPHVQGWVVCKRCHREEEKLTLDKVGYPCVSHTDVNSTQALLDEILDRMVENTAEYKEMQRRHAIVYVLMNTAWVITTLFVVYCMGRGLFW